MDFLPWIQTIGFVVILFIGIGFLNHIIDRITKPMEEIKDKLDEVLMYMKDNDTQLRDISENTLLARPKRSSFLTDENREKK